MPRKQHEQTKKWRKGKILEVTVIWVSCGITGIQLPNGELARVISIYSTAWRDKRDGNLPEKGEKVKIQLNEAWEKGKPFYPRAY